MNLKEVFFQQCITCHQSERNNGALYYHRSGEKLEHSKNDFLKILKQ